MPNFEKFAWLFMRFSGVVLVFLAIGHLFIMLMWDNGVYRLDFNFVAQRWASPFWQTWICCCCGWRSCTAATVCAPSLTTTAAKTPPDSG